MVKLFILLFVVFFSKIEYLSAQNATESSELSDELPSYDYFLCAYQKTNFDFTLRTQIGFYEKSVDKIIDYAKLFPLQECLSTRFKTFTISINKNVFEKYLFVPNGLNDFYQGIIDMTDSYVFATAYLETLKITKKGQLPKVGDIQVLPGGYAKQFTATGKWEDYNIRPFLEKLNWDE